MYLTDPSKVSTSAASYWAMQFGLYSAFKATALTSMTKLSDLNLHAMQEVLENSSKALHPLQPSDKPAASFQAQLAIDVARAYNRQLAGIAFEMRTKSSQLLQGSITAVHAQIDSCLDGLNKDAPDAASGVLQLMRSAICDVNTRYDQLMLASDRTARAVVDNLDDGFHPFSPPPPTFRPPLA